VARNPAPSSAATSSDGLETTGISFIPQHVPQHIPADARTALMQLRRGEVTDHMPYCLEDELGFHATAVA